MTLRQVFAIVWQRRVLTLVTAALVFLSALAYALLAPVTYTSTAQVRYSPAASATLEGGVGYGSIPLDLDADFAASPQIAEAAAETLPGDNAEAIQASVTVSVDEGVRSNRLSITATGASAEQASGRAGAVAQAYVDHLAGQINDGLTQLRSQLSAQQKEQSAALALLNRNPEDRLAQQRFNDASTQVTQIQTEITTVQSSGPPATVFQAATAGERQGMNMLSILGIGLVSGLIAGAGVSLIRHQFDEKLHSIEDVEEVIDGHILGDVALVSRQELATHPLPAASRVPTPFNESIRAIRTSLQVVFPQRHSVVVITSPEPGEGKTFLSANLAVSLAHAGRNVILIEGDLRRPRAGTYFPIPTGARGFANALDKNADSQTVAGWLVDTDFAGLRILPAGSSRREPADLLATESLSDVVERIRHMADIVIVDTPPGLALADAAIIGGQADGVVVVTSLNKSRASALAGTLQILRANRAEVVGVIANRSRRATLKSYMDYYTAASGSVHGDVPAGVGNPTDSPVQGAAPDRHDHHDGDGDAPPPNGFGWTPVPVPGGVRGDIPASGGNATILPMHEEPGFPHDRSVGAWHDLSSPAGHPTGTEAEPADPHPEPDMAPPVEETPRQQDWASQPGPADLGNDPLQDTAPRVLPWLVNPEVASMWDFAHNSGETNTSGATPTDQAPADGPPTNGGTQPVFFASHLATTRPGVPPQSPSFTAGPESDTPGGNGAGPSDARPDHYRPHGNSGGMPPDLFYGEDQSGSSPQEAADRHGMGLLVEADFQSQDRVPGRQGPAEQFGPFLSAPPPGLPAADGASLDGDTDGALEGHSNVRRTSRRTGSRKNRRN